ncbi:MAG: C40 family peptidase [Treponema sp.]|nr:C40 family peptidase [Treponema sp.]
MNRSSFGLPLYFLLFFISGNLFGAVPLSELAVKDARARVIRAAEEYQGIPYRYGGLDRRGLDCSGLVFLSFRDALNVSVPRTTETLYAWVEKVPDSKLLPGDLVFFNTLGRAGGEVSHVGIYMGDGTFIHAASEGPQTGVMYSRLNESYWRRTYVGAGRILPEGDPVLAPKIAVPGDAGSGGASSSTNDEARGFRLGLGLAPSWNGFLENGAFRGGVLQIQGTYDIHPFGYRIRLGIELRPEWDKALGVFRMPVTLSIGHDDRFRLFAGPAFTIGDPVLRTAGGDRHYTGGTAWLGTVGMTIAPFSFRIGKGTLSLYGELSWQSYFRDPALEADFNADLSAGLRISTGLRYAWGL